MLDLLQEKMGNNPNLHYHNWAHIEHCYENAGELGLPYDADLDMAILFHDSVYDVDPDKEKRSSAFMYEVAETYRDDTFKQLDLGIVSSMIMNTVTHRSWPRLNPGMIMVDLADLCYTRRTLDNHKSIMDENMALYNKSKYDCALANVNFMNELLDRVKLNVWSDLNNTKFWNEVEAGIQTTIMLSERITN